jgi:uncharacterized protein YuzE
LIFYGTPLAARLGRGPWGTYLNNSVTPVKNDVIYFLIDVPYGIPSGRGSPEESWGIEMKIKYFSDTDTALVEFSDRAVAETREINENIYIDLDRSGNLVAMTIEHARQQASLPFLSYEQIEEKSPNKAIQRMAKGRR